MQLLGMNPLTLPPNIPLELAQSEPGTVWIIGRDYGRGFDKADFFHAHRAQRIHFTPLMAHSKAFSNVHVLASYARFIVDQLDGHVSLLIMHRASTPAELIERAPLWWDKPGLDKLAK
jgi:hypothetical protein